MSEKAPQYHKAIEDVMVTSGEDTGRVKDKELAHELAGSMDPVRDLEGEMIEEGFSIQPKSQEEWNEKDNRFIKHEIARRAIDRAADTLLQNITVSGIKGEKLQMDPLEEALSLQRKAQIVGEDYDALQEKTKLVGEARENGAEFLDLSSDEFTATLAEAPIYRKSAIVKARAAEVGEVVVTVTPDGVEEGRNTAGEDDYVVTGVNGADFILPGEKFTKLYEETDENGVFQSRGMARIIDNPTGKKIGILAPWGEMQYGDSNSKIAVQYDSENPDVVGSDRYILDSNEFAAYKEVEPVA